MELGLTEFVTKIILYIDKQRSFGTIKEARCSSLNNLRRDSIKMNAACSVRQVNNSSIKMVSALKG